MKGDFSRNTFNPNNHYSRVLMQQGRVTVDADWNERDAIQLHLLRCLAADMIGPHGGPGDSFKIVACVNEEGQIRDENGNLIDCADDPPEDGDFLIFNGHYYVNGILCENDNNVSYLTQVDFPGQEPLSNGEYLVYLDVWERHITANENDLIREIALGGPDTATRAKSIWQVKVEPLTADREVFSVQLPTSGNNDPATTPPPSDSQVINRNWDAIVKILRPENRGQLQARANITEEMDLENPCTIDPDARYRGAENQLYRVEIHRGRDDSYAPTFKWSRENGSVTFPIQDVAGKTVSLTHLGRDGRFTLKEGDWVEPVNDDTVLNDQPQLLRQVQEVNRIDMTVILDETIEIDVDESKHPLLRRWDQQKKRAGSSIPEPDQYGVRLKEGWLDLEDGIQIQFELPRISGNPDYRSGDYWLIPARTATGDVEWPQLNRYSENPSPKPLPPHGTSHHYAPLAIIKIDENGLLSISSDCRYVFKQIVELAS